MDKQEINKTKKYIKSRLKTTQLGVFYTIYVKGVFFVIRKIRNNCYELILNDSLLVEMVKGKKYTKHNLINEMINIIEKEPSN